MRVFPLVLLTRVHLSRRLNSLISSFSVLEATESRRVGVLPLVLEVGVRLFRRGLESSGSVLPFAL